MSEITVLKLIDGSTVVGRVTQGVDVYEIEHPIEIVSHMSITRGVIGEQLSLRPWIAFSDTGVFTIDRINVLAITGLDQKYEAGYTNIVEATYLNENVYVEELPKAADLPTSADMGYDPMDDIDLETLAEYADAHIKKKIH